MPMAWRKALNFGIDIALGRETAAASRPWAKAWQPRCEFRRTLPGSMVLHRKDWRKEKQGAVLVFLDP